MRVYEEEEKLWDFQKILCDQSDGGWGGSIVGRAPQEAGADASEDEGSSGGGRTGQKREAV